jgi:hypothetical protein
MNTHHTPEQPSTTNEKKEFTPAAKQRRSNKFSWIMCGIALVLCAAGEYALSWRNILPLSEEERSTCGAYMDDLSSQSALKLCRINPKEVSAPAQAVEDYLRYITDYTGNPLATAAESRVAELFAHGKAGELTSTSGCGSLTSLLDRKVVLYTSSYVPAMLYQCGQTYAEQKMLAESITAYETFMAHFPAHSLAVQAEAGMARSIIQFAKGSAAGSIQQPGLANTLDSPTATLTLQNGTHYPVRIAYSGPEGHVKELPACETCTTADASATTCSNQGPVVEYQVAPGQYDVVFQTINDSQLVHNPSAPRWTSSWNLARGGQYSGCVVLVPVQSNQYRSP